MCEIKVKLLPRFLFFFQSQKLILQGFSLNNTNDEGMRREGAADPGEDPRKAEAGARVLLLQRTIPDIFKVAVWGLGRLLLGGQVQLFRKLPQASSMKDPWRRTQTHTESLHLNALFYRLNRSRYI